MKFLMFTYFLLDGEKLYERQMGVCRIISDKGTPDVTAAPAQLCCAR